MSVIHFFELICDGCKERFEDLHERALVTPIEVRAAAKKQGWASERPSRFHPDYADLCANCNGNGKGHTA